MTIFGVPIETFYLNVFIVGVISVLIYVLIGDLFEALEAVISIGILNPTVIFSLITIFSGSGYIFETESNLSSMSGAIISLIIALVLVSLIHFFVLVPLKNSETSTAYAMSDFIGRHGVVIASIATEGYGEVLFKSDIGNISRTAKSSDGSYIKVGNAVTVESISENTVIVKLLSNLDDSLTI